MITPMSLSTGGLRMARLQPILLNHGLQSTTTISSLALRRQIHVPARPYPRSRSPILALTRAASTAPQTKPTSTSPSPLSPPRSRAAPTPRAAPKPPAPTPRPAPTPPSPTPSPTQSPALLTPSETLNPPSSTLPPPLVLPVRADANSLFSHLYALGKAYTGFYKAGLKAVFANRRLVRSSPPPSSPPRHRGTPTRAEILLRQRSAHDLIRLPLFGLLVLLCGEFTPLIVVLVPQLSPYTCRIPRQVAVLRRRAEARRGASLRALKYTTANNASQSRDATEAQVQTGEPLRAGAAGHIARSLSLTSSLWDRLGLDGPFARRQADRAVAYLAHDNALIRDGGGVAGLVDDEVVLACEDRGMDVLDKEVGELRGRLEAWLRETAPRGGKGGEEVEVEDKIRRLFLGLHGKR
ncbi:hypothetical protein F5B20DRAFT_537686 [Whalleya microplaca]|nr:hypothetical protein F5B20DRAFT_537686 [Whalleya microplaca]